MGEQDLTAGGANNEVSDFHHIARTIGNEISTVLSLVDESQVDALITEIHNAERIFMIAVGRVFLSLQCFAKRLAHLGLKVEVVGQITEKAITNKDLLLIASGSGESAFPIVVAQKGKQFNARLALITSATDSTVSRLSDCIVRLPSPTKLDGDLGVQSSQPMSTLFDQTLHVFGDIVSMKLLDQSKFNKDELWQYHANLE